MIFKGRTQEQAVQVPELTSDELDLVVGGSPLASSLKLMSEILSNVSKTRSEISMTFARNARA